MPSPIGVLLPIAPTYLDVSGSFCRDSDHCYETKIEWIWMFGQPWKVVCLSAEMTVDPKATLHRSSIEAELKKGPHDLWLADA